MQAHQNQSDFDDPRLTAYALGELDQSEVPEIEALLAKSAPHREFVRQVQSAAEILTAELGKEEGAALSDEQRGAIEREWRENRDERAAPVARRRNWVPLSLAASLAIVLSGWGALSLFRSGDEALDIDVEVAQGASLSEELYEDESGARPSSISAAIPDRNGLGSKPAPGETPSMNWVEGSQALEPDVARVRNELGKNFDNSVKDNGDGLTLDQGGVNGKHAQRESKPAPGRASRRSLSTLGYAGSDEGRSRRPSGGSFHDDSEEGEGFNTEAYDHIAENPFISVAQDPLSTFSIDVDTASYANVRRFLSQGQRPPKDAVRIEELLNYFSYDYPNPSGNAPFAVHTEVAGSPWNPKNRLVRIGLKGREIHAFERRPANLVFLIDVSGSMSSPQKLPLLKRSMRLLVENLNHQDRVAMVVYAGASGLVLPSTPCSQRASILAALENLNAGGSTNGGAGIELAYATAAANMVEGGINRVILATDGDFNVGTTNQGDLVRLIQEKAKSKIFLSVLGFGSGNLKDSTMEKLANKGNGNYAYIDSLREAQKCLVEELGGTLDTIAKDVKIQVEFNPSEVQAFRLIGYENRKLAHQDFKDDKKDAGEIGAGHTVTALYELVPAGVASDVELPQADPLTYQRPTELTSASGSGELMTVKLRYKQPEGDKSVEMSVPVVDAGYDIQAASVDFKFAAAVAGFGMCLRESEHRGATTFEAVKRLASDGQGQDSGGYRAEFLQLVQRAIALQ